MHACPTQQPANGVLRGGGWEAARTHSCRDETPVNRVLRSPPGVNGPSKYVRKYHQDGEGVDGMHCYFPLGGISARWPVGVFFRNSAIFLFLGGPTRLIRDFG